MNFVESSYGKYEAVIPQSMLWRTLVLRDVLQKESLEKGYTFASCWTLSNVLLVYILRNTGINKLI